MPLVAGGLAHRAVQTLDAADGAADLADLGREREEEDHLLRCAAPTGDDGRVLLVHLGQEDLPTRRLAIPLEAAVGFSGQGQLLGHQLRSVQQGLASTIRQNKGALNRRSCAFLSAN